MALAWRNTELLAALGCQVDEGGAWIVADTTRRTSEPGVRVWASSPILGRSSSPRPPLSAALMDDTRDVTQGHQASRSL
jgi:hypothetical protein